MAPMDQDVPLLRLPPELRLRIYEFLFTGAKIHIHPPINLYRIRKYKTPEQDRLPGILMVSHQIRNETLPHFAKHLTPIFYRYPYILGPIPRIYLSQARTVWLADRWSSPVSRAEVPNLEEVKVLHMGYRAPDQHCLKICGYTTVHETEKDIVNRIFPEDSLHSLCFVDKLYGGYCVSYKAWLK